MLLPAPSATEEIVELSRIGVFVADNKDDPRNWPLMIGWPLLCKVSTVPVPTATTDCWLPACPLIAMLACNVRDAAVVLASPKAVDGAVTTYSGEIEAFDRLPPAWLRMNGMFDCSAASGCTAKAKI